MRIPKSLSLFSEDDDDDDSRPTPRYSIAEAESFLLSLVSILVQLIALTSRSFPHSQRLTENTHKKRRDAWETGGNIRSQGRGGKFPASEKRENKNDGEVSARFRFLFIISLRRLNGSGLPSGIVSRPRLTIRLSFCSPAT